MTHALLPTEKATLMRAYIDGFDQDSQEHYLLGRSFPTDVRPNAPRR